MDYPMAQGANEEYEGTYGVKANGAALDLGFVTKGQYASNVGSRTFLLDDDDHYQLFKLKNREFTFDVDASKLPCGINGALYFVQMDADGGSTRFPSNKAGARYGTGYCGMPAPHATRAPRSTLSAGPPFPPARYHRRPVPRWRARRVARCAVPA